ncbi:hypothetical protein MRX96_028236 [Rhipicephalus microplus]
MSTTIVLTLLLAGCLSAHKGVPRSGFDVAVYCPDFELECENMCVHIGHKDGFCNGTVCMCEEHIVVNLERKHRT